MCYANGPYQFCAPPAGNVFWRWFYPAQSVREKELPGEHPAYTGGFRDYFGNPFTMLAVANPEREELQNSMPRIRYLVNEEEAARGGHLRRTSQGDGFGMLRFDMKRRRMIVEAWPVTGHAMFSGFPQIVDFDSIEQPGSLDLD